MPRILIADSCDVVRSGIRRILQAEPNLHIVEEATDGEEAISKATACQPDVVIVEICLPKRNGIDVTHHVRKHLPQAEALIFTLHEEELWISDGLRAGARGYIFKSDPGHCLLDATRSLAVHVPYFTARAAELLIRSYRGPRRSRTKFAAVGAGMLRPLSDGSHQECACVLPTGGQQAVVLDDPKKPPRLRTLY